MRVRSDRKPYDITSLQMEKGRLEVKAQQWGWLAGHTPAPQTSLRGTEKPDLELHPYPTILSHGRVRPRLVNLSHPGPRGVCLEERGKEGERRKEGRRKGEGVRIHVHGTHTQQKEEGEEEEGKTQEGRDRRER